MAQPRAQAQAVVTMTDAAYTDMAARMLNTFILSVSLCSSDRLSVDSDTQPNTSDTPSSMMQRQNAAINFLEANSDLRLQCLLLVLFIVLGVPTIEQQTEGHISTVTGQNSAKI